MMFLAMMAIPAGAQISPNIIGESMHRKTDVEAREEQRREKDFKAGISKIPDQKAKADPWGDVRGAGAPQPNNPQRSGSK
jgi:hypothetical protein